MINFIVILYCLTIPKRIFGIIFRVPIICEEVFIMLKVFDGQIHVTDGAHYEDANSVALLVLACHVPVGRALLPGMLEFLVIGPSFKLETRVTND